MTDNPTEAMLPVTQAALEPCPNPWCESHVRPERNYVPFVESSRASSEKAVSCPVCPMRGPWADNEAEAIAAWNTRASTPPVGETSALAEELGQCKAGRQRFEHFDSRKLSVDYLVPEDLFNRILAALNKPAEPVGDEVERVARAIAAATVGPNAAATP